MKNRHSLAITIALIALILTSFVAPDAQAQRRRSVDRHSTVAILHGIVTDAATGDPLPDATVTIKSTERYTDSEGFYEFDTIAPGTWTVTADRWGYLPSSREIVVSTGENTADFALDLAPSVIVTRTTGEVEHYAAETVKFGYVVPFAGTFASETLTVCTGDPEMPTTLERGSIARIQGPATRVSTPCCPNFNGEQITIDPKDGAAFEAVILDSCPPNDIYFIGRSVDTGKSIHRRLSEVTLIEFP